MASAGSLLAARDVSCTASPAAYGDLASRAYGASPAGKGFVWTDTPFMELPIRIGSSSTDLSSMPPSTLHDVMQDIVTAHGPFPALRVKRGGTWQSWSYVDYYDQCRAFARACLHPSVDLQSNQGVGILAFNSPEWVISGVGAVFAGGLLVGIYTTNSAEATHYVLSHCDAGVCIVDDPQQLAKVLSVRDKLPYLKAIVLSQGELPPQYARESGVYTWAAFLALGADVPEAALRARLAAQRPGNCCSIIYTSGTTGNPKGVMLSHDNIVFTTTAANLIVNAKRSDVIVSYLPLSHIAAQITDLYGPLMTGITVAFAQPDALKGTLIQTLQEIRPTYFLGVPRVYEKIEERLRAIGAQNAATSPLKKYIGDWAKAVGAEGSKAQLTGTAVPWLYPVANAIVFKNIKAALGLDRCRIMATGAAPISRTTLDYFASLGMILQEAYGMSESTGPHTTNVVGAGTLKFGTVGRPLSGVEVRIDKPDPVNGEGEVCMRGRNVFMGYLKNPTASAETIDIDGWLHSGDLGVVDKDGFVRITGRLKELLITAGGENVAPVLMEDAIKWACPAISNVMLVGDRQRFISALITLKCEPDADGQPTTQLLDVAQAWVKDVGSQATTTTAACTCPFVKKALQAAVDKANATAISNASKVQRWTLVPTDFSINGGELTPTMKLKRKVTTEKYAAVIQAMYAAPDAAAPNLSARL